MQMSILVIIFLVLILSIALYYGLFSVDIGTINDDYAIPIAVVFLLITNGLFMGNNGFTGDFGLDYCNDKDQYSEYIDETEVETVHPESFFACELGYIDGVVDLGWRIYTGDQKFLTGFDDEMNVMILNHDNYKNFVNGKTYGVSNFYLSELQTSVLYNSGETTKYKVGITLHSDSYFFVVEREYGNNRGLIGPNSQTSTSGYPIGFLYVVDLDYDTSGVVTTN